MRIVKHFAVLLPAINDALLSSTSQYRMVVEAITDEIKRYKVRNLNSFHENPLCCSEPRA
jgi:hypothetical protein